MNANPQPPLEEREIHLRDYWNTIWRGRYTVLTIFVIVVGLSMLRVMLATPIYQASALLEIKPEARQILPGQEQWVGADGRNWISDEKYFNTQLQVLKSRDLAERVYYRLGLDRDPAFDGLHDPVAAFVGRLQVSPRVNTRLVTVSMTGTDPSAVTEWVNVLAETYVQRNVDEATKSFHGIMDQIRREMASFRTNIGQADQERFASAKDLELYVPENQQQILNSTLETYNERLTEVRMNLGTLSAELVNLERTRNEKLDPLALARVSDDPVVSDLVSQRIGVERELETLRTQGRRESHPVYRTKQGELDEINRKIADNVGRIEEELRTEYRLARGTEASLKSQIRQTEQDLYEVRQMSTNYEIEKSDAESKRKVYDLVAETVERLNLGAQLIAMNNNVSVLDRAIEPRAPIKPRKKLAAAVASAIGLLLGVGAVLFLDYLDNTIRSPEDVEQVLGIGVPAIIPKYRDANAGAVREAFQSLRTSILFSSHNREKNVLLMTSAGPQEGKSSTVYLVARTMASAGDRVIVVDCDLRRPTQHRHMSIPREPGLTNYLSDPRNKDFTAFVRNAAPNLDVIACGPIPPNPAELVGHARFGALVATLKQKYDWVLLDSPPVANLADTVVLASLVDLGLLVIKHNKNDRDLVRRCLKRLREVDLEVMGAVLNAVDVERASYGGYYYANYDYVDSEKTERRKRARSRSGGDDADRVAL